MIESLLLERHRGAVTRLAHDALSQSIRNLIGASNNKQILTLVVSGATESHPEPSSSQKRVHGCESPLSSQKRSRRSTNQHYAITLQRLLDQCSSSVDLPDVSEELTEAFRQQLHLDISRQLDDSTEMAE
jgi:hypothetical protein